MGMGTICKRSSRDTYSIQSGNSFALAITLSKESERVFAGYLIRDKISFQEHVNCTTIDLYIRKVNNMITEVVAALIWAGDRFMICQRPAHKARGLLWEFVGGKVEAGETKEAALIRECQEELAVILSVGDVFMEVVHEYPDIIVRLTLFNATIAEGVPQKLEHNDIRWITPAEVPQYDFCPADVEMLDKIMELKA